MNDEDWKVRQGFVIAVLLLQLGYSTVLLNVVYAQGLITGKYLLAAEATWLLSVVISCLLAVSVIFDILDRLDKLPDDMSREATL
jgi:hypothetical protein